MRNAYIRLLALEAPCTAVVGWHPLHHASPEQNSRHQFRWYPWHRLRTSHAPSLLRLYTGHIFHTWKKRWFVLDQQLLKYYKSSDEGSSAGMPQSPQLSELKGCINLLNCKVETLADGESRPFCFRITPMSNKVRAHF